MALPSARFRSRPDEDEDQHREESGCQHYPEQRHGNSGELQSVPVICPHRLVVGVDLSQRGSRLAQLRVGHVVDPVEPITQSPSAAERRFDGQRLHVLTVRVAAPTAGKHMGQAREEGAMRVSDRLRRSVRVVVSYRVEEDPCVAPPSRLPGVHTSVHAPYRCSRYPVGRAHVTAYGEVLVGSHMLPGASRSWASLGSQPSAVLTSVTGCTTD